MTAFVPRRLLAAWKRIRGSPDRPGVSRVAYDSEVEGLMTTAPTPAEAPGSEQVAEPLPSDPAEGNTKESSDSTEALSMYVAESTLKCDVPASEPDSADAIIQPQPVSALEDLPETQRGPQALTDQAQISSGARDRSLEVAPRIIDEYRRIELTAREARNLSEAALQAAQEVAQRLETLAEVRDLCRKTDNQLAVLSGLAEHITHRVEALERESGAIEDRMVDFTRQRAEIENMTMELGRATDDQLTVLSGLVEHMTGRVDALERLSGTIEGRMVAFTEQKAEIDKMAVDLGRLSKLEHLVGLLVSVVQELRKPQAVGHRLSAEPSLDLTYEHGVRPGGSGEVPEFVTVSPPAFDLPAGTRENRTRRWRRFATNLRAASGRLERHRLALASVGGVLIVVASAVIISTGRGQVVERADPPRQDPSSSSTAPNPPPGIEVRTPAAEVQSRRDSFDDQVAERRPQVSPANTGAPKGSPPRPRFLGTLLVNSDPPGASVLVDGQPVGVTPVELAGFRAGSHVVRMEREGYQRWSSAVSVTAYQTTRITAKLEVEADR